MTAFEAPASVARIAAYCRAEQLAFALLGDGATRFAPVAGAAELSEAADHAAWRARRWYELLPTAPPGPDALLVPTEGDLEVARRAREVVVDGVTLLAVVAVEVLPRVLRAMEEHSGRTTDVADRPVRRILDIAICDVERDLLVLLDVHGRSLAVPSDPERADLASGAVAAVADRLDWPVAGI